jgi:hypothetical protein
MLSDHSDEQEQEADWYAAALLLPEASVASSDLIAALRLIAYRGKAAFQ